VKLVFALCVLVAISVEAETRDGFWWVRQDQNTKILYVLGSVDRTMLTGSIDDGLKRSVVGTPRMDEIVAQVDRVYSRQEARPMLVQEAIAVALYEIAQSASKR
jgi:hypothetical protein